MTPRAVRLLRLVAGGQRFCLPLDAVTGIETIGVASPWAAMVAPAKLGRQAASSADGGKVMALSPTARESCSAIGDVSRVQRAGQVVSLATRLGLAEEHEARQVVRAIAAECELALAVDGTVGTRTTVVLPLTPVADAAGLSAAFVGLAAFDDGPALALDLEALLRPAGSLLASGASKMTEGEPVLVCRVGNVSLRGRAIAVGLPLSCVLAVRQTPVLVPLPSCPSPVIGAAAFGDRAVPVIDVAAALGWPPLERRQRMVVFRGRSGPLGLLVEAADRIERTDHWAAPSCLAPLHTPALVGAIPSPSCWIAVLAPERLSQPRTAAHPAA